MICVATQCAGAYIVQSRSVSSYIYDMRMTLRLGARGGDAYKTE